MARFGTFFDGELSWLERGCIASFVRCGHTVTLYSYTPLDPPHGVIRADAAKILPRARIFHAPKGVHRGSVSAFTNLFRYEMIRQTGFIWIDTDVYCLRGDWPEKPLLIGKQDEASVNGAVLGADPAHPLIADARDIAERIGAHSVWGYTGPHLLTALIHEHRLQREVLPVNSFYPIPFRDAPQLLVSRPGADRIRWPEETLAVHLWHEMLRLNGFDRRASPPAQSLLALMFAATT